ncbi:hypothetical protein D3C75_986050 [compost metagenome]
MLCLVVEDLVVDFVGKDDQVVLTGDLDDLFQQFFAVDRAGGVVRVDDHDATGTWSDFAANIVQIREPARFFVAHIVHGLAAGKRYGGGPQRVVWRRHQHFITDVQQRLHGLHD